MAEPPNEEAKRCPGCGLYSCDGHAGMPAGSTPQAPAQATLDASVRERVDRNTRSVLRANPDLHGTIEAILLHEAKGREEHAAKQQQFAYLQGAEYNGWEPGEVPVPQPHLKKLQDAALIRLGYSSRSVKQWILVDAETTQRALTEEALQAQPALSTERVAEFEAVAASGKALDHLAGLVAPHVYGLERAKRAVILVLASLNDSKISRGRMSALFDGPPGGAKTDMLIWAAGVAGVEVYGPRSTGPGLTVNLQTGQPGVLPQAHNTEFALVCVDEAEKVPGPAIQHTLQALEDGQFTVNSAHGVETFPAAVRGLFAANEPDDLPPAFLDRMDFRIHIPMPDKEQGKRIIASVAMTFMTDGEASQPDFVRDYLRWCRDFKPAFTREGREASGKLLGHLVEMLGQEGVRVRQYQAILRIAYAIARLNRQNVTPEVVLEAVEVLHPDLNGKVDLLRALLKKEA